MRNPSALRRSDSTIPWKWIAVVIVIFTILFFLRSIGSGTDEDLGKGISINGSGTFIVTTKDGSKKDVQVGDKFYESDLLFSVVGGSAELSDMSGKFWLDKNSEVAHSDTSTGGYSLGQGRMWIEATKDLMISLKHLDIQLSDGDIVLLEQQRIYSIAYVLKGDTKILGGGRESSLKGGQRIMVSQSNLINPGVSLESLIGDIDDSIQQNAFFLARNGKTLLENAKLTPTTASNSGTIGSISGSGNTISSDLSGKIVAITSPNDGSVITGSVFVIEGKSLVPQVKKIAINDQSITLTQSPGTFRSAPISVTTASIDVVYKAYDAGNNLLDRGVLTLYSDAKLTGTDKLVPKTFPTSDKDFRIVSPTENPFKTSLSAVTVSGTVPKGAVEYITVNNFRLKKFVAGSTNWYYYANTAYQTMKDGFNLYEIRFYGQNDTLLSTQLFTIIKEGTNTLSGEL